MTWWRVLTDICLLSRAGGEVTSGSKSKIFGSYFKSFTWVTLATGVLALTPGRIRDIGNQVLKGYHLCITWKRNFVLVFVLDSEKGIIKKTLKASLLNLSIHQNHLDDLLQHILLAPLPEFLNHEVWGCPENVQVNQLSGAVAASSGFGTSLLRISTLKNIRPKNMHLTENYDLFSMESNQ